MGRGEKTEAENTSVRMAGRLGEEMASELRLAECLGEGACSELKNLVGEDHYGGFEVLEGHIRRLMARMEEFDNERKKKGRLEDGPVLRG